MLKNTGTQNLIIYRIMLKNTRTQNLQDNTLTRQYVDTIV